MNMMTAPGRPACLPPLSSAPAAPAAAGEGEAAPLAPPLEQKEEAKAAAGDEEMKEEKAKEKEAAAVGEEVPPPAPPPEELPPPLPFDDFGPPPAAPVDETSMGGPSVINTIVTGAGGESTFLADAPPSAAIEAPSSTGWSARTQKMYAFLKNQADSQFPLHFFNLLRSKSRHVAACTFFELLVLKSHGHLGLTQSKPFADILISKTENFDQAAETMGAQSEGQAAAASVAPSTA